MGSDIYLNLLWLVPLVAWFATRSRPQLLRSSITAFSFGLVVTHASFGLHALHLDWPVSEAFGQLGFYSSYIHVKAGVPVATFLNLVPDHMPITGDKKLLIVIVNSVSWAFAYGVLGLLWGLVRKKFDAKPGKTKTTDLVT